MLVQLVVLLFASGAAVSVSGCKLFAERTEDKAKPNTSEEGADQTSTRQPHPTSKGAEGQSSLQGFTATFVPPNQLQFNYLENSAVRAFIVHLEALPPGEIHCSEASGLQFETNGSLQHVIIHEGARELSQLFVCAVEARSSGWGQKRLETAFPSVISITRSSQ